MAGESRIQDDEVETALGQKPLGIGQAGHMLQVEIHRAGTSEGLEDERS